MIITLLQTFHDFPQIFFQFIVNGEPLECTIECDYSVINVSGNYHQLYVIGMHNQVNLIGSYHTIYFEGFTNQVNFCTDVKNGKIYVKGDSPLAFAVGVSNGEICSDGDMTQTKLEFPSDLKSYQRRRVIWQSLSVAKTDEANANTSNI